MTDPLDALREPIVPHQPDPAFAERLRARLRAAVLAREGETVTTTQATTHHEGDVGYLSLWLHDPERATRFYGAVLGWRFEPAREGHGARVENTRLRIGTARREAAEHPTAFLAHAVENVHETVRRVRRAGGTAEDPHQEPYGLIADCADDQGLRFAVFQAPTADRPQWTNDPGEVAYLTIGVPDSARFRAFYGAVFGWTFTPGHVDDGWSVTGPRPMTGMHGGAERPVIKPMYVVEDIAAAVRRVRAAGGTATDPERRPYGVTSECVDDQGSEFYLGQW